MKPLIKLLIIFLTISFSISSTSCSKKNHGYKYSNGPKYGASSYDPVARKDHPVRKKYIINNKRRNILGHEKPFKGN